MDRMMSQHEHLLCRLAWFVDSNEHLHNKYCRCITCIMIHFTQSSPNAMADDFNGLRANNLDPSSLGLKKIRLCERRSGRGRLPVVTYVSDD